MSYHVAHVVENPPVFFPFKRTHNAAELLTKEGIACGGPGKRNNFEGGEVKAFAENIHVYKLQ
tara:strand:- start:515 stop:703 length:189 start_codon:yes stop_codon:yes gene_type:complete